VTGIDLNLKKKTYYEDEEESKIVVYLTSLCVNWAFFGMSGPIYTRTSCIQRFFVRRVP
jgi:hypothetical protein